MVMVGFLTARCFLSMTRSHIVPSTFVQVRYRRGLGPKVKARFGPDGERIVEETPVVRKITGRERENWGMDPGGNNEKSVKKERPRKTHPEALFGVGALPGAEFHRERNVKDIKNNYKGINDNIEDRFDIKSMESVNKSEEEDLNEEKFDKEKYPVPKYTKVNGWDKKNKHLKNIGKILTNKQKRTESDFHVLEGVRIIRDAIQQGYFPSIIVFSRVKLLWELELPPELPKECSLFHIPYSSIKLWTDMTTSPGIMAALPKAELQVSAKYPLPITIICDKIRGPDNLGSVMRVAAAVGARKVICLGCTDVWSSKAVRAGAGAHFHVPVEQGVGWAGVRDLLEDPWSQVLLAELPSEERKEEEVVTLSVEETQRRVDALENRLVEEGSHEEDIVDVMEMFKELPLPSLEYSQFQLQPGFKEVVVVIGGETEGVSGEAYRFCHKLGGSKIHLPLRNHVNSLNVVSATSVILFKIQQVLLDRERSEKNNRSIENIL